MISRSSRRVAPPPTSHIESFPFNAGGVPSCVVSSGRTPGRDPRFVRCRPARGGRHLERLERLERGGRALRGRSPARGRPPAPAAAPDAVELAELARRVDLLAEELETLRVGEAAVKAEVSERGFGPAASKIYRAHDGLSVGGYGEIVYQNWDRQRDDGTPSGRTAEADVLRGVVYFGYKWSDRWLLNTNRVRARVDQRRRRGGVEFAYLDHLWRDG